MPLIVGTIEGTEGDADGADGIAGWADCERRYVRTLAQSIIRYVAAGNLGQAFAICIGLAVATAAFGRARLERARLKPTTAVSGTH
jgi:hypothetical protein